jgi:hypothetical protein
MIFLLGSSATFYLTQVTLKSLYFSEIIDIPLAFCTTHIFHSNHTNKHTYIVTKPSVPVSNYLNVTAFPPKKNLVPRF